MDALADWIALKNVPGIGNRLYKRLIEVFGSPKQVFAAPRRVLIEVKGVSARLADAIKHGAPSRSDRREVKRTRAQGWRIVTINDGDYPPLLVEIPDPPPYLYLAGSLPDQAVCIAIVGSRNATDYGIETAHRLGRDLARRGVTVVSGMAVGIDTAAHCGALAGGGSTVAVMGSGFCRIYPHRNRNLFHKIAANGAIVTEFALDAGPEAHHFPQRNRVISGICVGTVVVEATRNSGSLITATLAAEQNREVFAVPGSVQSFKSVGTHKLIKQGAKLVEHVGDIMEELPAYRLVPTHAQSQPVTKASALAPPELDPDLKRVYDRLDAYGIHIDRLVERTGIEAGALAAQLLRLEIYGLATQMPGKYFKRKALENRD